MAGEDRSYHILEDISQITADEHHRHTDDSALVNFGHVRYYRYPYRYHVPVKRLTYVAIDERGWVRIVHLLVCVHYAVKYYIVVCPV